MDVALAISVVILLVGLWFHRQRDRPVLARNSGDVFTRPWAIAYLAVIALLWVSTIVVTVLQLVTGQSEFETQEAAIALPGLVILGLAVFTVFRTARAIEAHDPDLQGPVGQLGRFVRVGYGTSAVAAFRYVRGQSYP